MSSRPERGMERNGSSLRNASILVVDEDPAFQLGLKTFLKDHVGFGHVFTARNGREALERLQQDDTIELVTLDYKMPEMDGITFLEKLRETHPEPVGVVMITGYPSESLKGQFKSFATDTLLVEHFLAKPIEFRDLDAVVKETHETIRQIKQKRSTPPTTAVTATAAAGGRDRNQLVLSRLEALSSTVQTRLDKLEEKIDKAVKPRGGFFGRLVADLLRLAVLALVVVAFLHYGVFDKVREGFEKVPEWVQSVQSKFATPAKPNEVTPPAEEGDGAGDDAGPAPSAKPGGDPETGPLNEPGNEAPKADGGNADEPAQPDEPDEQPAAPEQPVPAAAALKSPAA